MAGRGADQTRAQPLSPRRRPHGEGQYFRLVDDGSDQDEPIILALKRHPDLTQQIGEGLSRPRRIERLGVQVGERLGQFAWIGRGDHAAGAGRA